MGLLTSDHSEQQPAQKLQAVEAAHARVDVTDDPEELRLIVRELLSTFDFAPGKAKSITDELEDNTAEGILSEVFCSGCGEVDTCECPDPTDPELPRTLSHSS